MKGKFQSKAVTVTFPFRYQLNGSRVEFGLLVFRNIELKKVFGANTEEEKEEMILRFSNEDLDKFKKDFTKDAEGVEVAFHSSFFESSVMDTMLKHSDHIFETLSRLESIEESPTNNNFSDEKIYSYLEKIFIQMIKTAEKIMDKINENPVFLNLKNKSKEKLDIMLDEIKDDQTSGRYYNF